MFDHSKECTVPLAEFWSSRAALAMGSSWSPFQFPLQMSDRIFCSMPVSSTLPEHVPQGIPVVGGLCSHCPRLRFRDWLSLTVRPVCP